MMTEADITDALLYYERPVTVAEQQAVRRAKGAARIAKRSPRKHGAAPGGDGSPGQRWQEPGRGKHPMPSSYYHG